MLTGCFPLFIVLNTEHRTLKMVMDGRPCLSHRNAKEVPLNILLQLCETATSLNVLCLSAHMPTVYGMVEHAG